MNTVGHNCREDVEAYIASQVDAACFADPSFRDMLKEFTTIREDVDLSLPTESLHGRYWYNLHLVLVNAERYPVVVDRRLAGARFLLQDCGTQGLQDFAAFRHARPLACRAARQHRGIPAGNRPGLSEQPCLRPGASADWACTFYVGTFGEYDMWAIRRKERPLAPP